MAYVRADGVNAIVYRSSAGHIIELRRGSRGFLKTDLMAASGAPSDVDAASDPVATVRSDGYSSIVFRSTAGQVVELYRAVGGDWHIGSPSGVAGAPAAVDRPFVYTERDGTNAIVYRTELNRIIKLTLSGSQWTWAQIATNGAGSPVAYTRTDAVTAVMFRSTASKLVQVTGATTDLTTLTGAANAATSPAVYVRNDGYNAVLFETSANHVGELFVRRGGTWGSGDITAVAGETP